MLDLFDPFGSCQEMFEMSFPSRRIIVAAIPCGFGEIENASDPLPKPLRGNGFGAPNRR